MKKFALTIFMLAFVLATTILQPNVASALAGYFPPNTSASGFVNNMALIYTGHYGATTDEGREIGIYDKNTFLPYVAHYNNSNVMDDTFFDTFLFLGLRTPEWRYFGDSADSTIWTYKTDWDWYINRIFTANQQLDALNQATAEAAAALGLSNNKSKVYIMIPFPNSEITNFGDVDNDGISENLNSTSSNMYKVAKWYIDTVIGRWNQSNFSNLELTGFYWLEEDIHKKNKGEVNAINSSGNYLHTLGLKLAWCPWSGASERNNWANYSIDFTILQPNHYFFMDTDYSRITSTATQAQTYQEGVEMEFDEAVLYDPDRYKRFYNYMKGGIQYGYMTGAIKGWYQDVYGIYNLYRNKGNNGVTGSYNGRLIYNDIYKFVKGVYTLPVNLALNKPAVSSSNETASFTADKAVDGNATTRWSSLYSNPQWIYVDLGQSYNINHVRLHWETAYAKSYKIQVSNDAANWTDVYSTTTGDGGIDDITFTPTNARYVRVYATEQGTIYWYSLYEVEVYGG